jgi:hypothetical protein
VVLQVKLSTTTNAAWKKQEATILALGVVAEGCISGLLPHLSWVPFPLLESIPWFQNPLFSIVHLLSNNVFTCAWCCWLNQFPRKRNVWSCEYEMGFKEKIMIFAYCNIFVPLLEDKCPLVRNIICGHFHTTTSGLFEWNDTLGLLFIGIDFA